MKKVLIVVGILFAVGMVATVISAMSRMKLNPASEQVPLKEETTNNEEWFKTCGTAQAYVLAKGAVKQAIHSEASSVFPSMEDGFVQAAGDGSSFVVTAHFFRADSKVPFEVGMLCTGGDWQYAYVKVNGMDAKPGMGL